MPQHSSRAAVRLRPGTRRPVSTDEGFPMLLHHRGRDGGRDVEVDVHDPDATVADLAAGLEPGRPPGAVVVDGRAVPAATPLDRAGVGTGSVVELGPPAPGPGPGGPGAPQPDAVTSVQVVGGIDAGRRWDLPPGRHVIGRGAGPDGAVLAIDDPTVSRRHAVLVVDPSGTIDVADAGSTNGTWLAGSAITTAVTWPEGAGLRCGAATLAHRAPPPVDPGGPRRTVAPPWPWHRRPVPARPLRDDSLVEPPGDDDALPPGTAGVGIAAVLGSLLVGGAMVWLLGSWVYALFALLGPVTLAAGAIDGRFRRRRSARRRGRRRRAALSDLDRTLGERLAAELAHLDAGHPGPADAVDTSGAAATDEALAREPSDRLWTERPGSSGPTIVRLGTGVVPWSPPVAGEPRHWPREVVEVVDRHRSGEGPVVVALRPGRPLAIVGPTAARRALARSIVVQAVATTGPADLRTGAIVTRAGADEWSWLRWLPHAADPTVPTPQAIDPSGDATGDAPDDAPLRLVVVDDPVGLGRGRSPARAAVRSSADPLQRVAALVLVASRADAPASCTIVEVDADGTLRAPAAVVAGPAVACGVALDVATRVARALARFDDPEVDDHGRDLPAVVTLPALLGAEALSSAGIAARWNVGGVDPRPIAALGRTADGPLVVDLAADGPHALVAGTTGAGKSELLRALVAGLALSCGPDHLVFVLVDFKGGSAFDACARLPHTVGVVTDLDDQLAARALRCLEAELRHREARFRAAGVPDLASFRRAAGRDDEPLPRLVVVVDEFATLAAELPDFVDALVGVAQRGRSLGVHLVLATQRPAGAVSDNIRANTALRVCLRVQDPADSVDVVGVPDAAHLPRQRAGRAVVRLGPGDLVAAQTVWTGAPAPDPDAPRVAVRPLGLSSDGRSRVDRTHATDDDLVRTVSAVRAAWTASGGRAPRRPWPDPLPDLVDLRAPVADVAPDAGSGDPGLVLGLADDPDHQRLAPHRWDPAEGPLLLVGRPGSGTSTGLATAVLAAAGRWGPGSLHVHVIDMGAGDLAPLAGLPHVGAVVRGDEHERQRRLLDHLGADLAARRARPVEARPRRLLVVDGVAGFHDRWDDADPTGTWARLVDVVTRGSEVGIHTVLAADGALRVPHRLLSACPRRLVLALADAAEGAAVGMSAASAVSARDVPPGRGIDPEGGVLVQLGRHGADLGAAVARVGARWEVEPDAPRAGAVQVLPDLVLLSAVGPGSTASIDGSLRLVVGVSDVDLRPALLLLPPGGHALVTGPPRSGRTTALRTVAAAAAETGAAVLAVSRARWDQRAVRWCAPDDPALATELDRAGPLLVVVDDADLSADDHPELTAAVRERRPDRHVVAAARSDRLRTRYAHWTREVRADRCGVLLRPDPDVDGDLTGTRLPRTAPVAPAPGRGWLLGDPEGYAQLAIARAD